MESNRGELFETIGKGAAGPALGVGIFPSDSCESPGVKKQADGRLAERKYESGKLPEIGYYERYSR